MSETLDVDVVVVGFGLAGASAAVEAARSGARVLAVDRSGTVPGPGPAAALGDLGRATRNRLRGELRAAAVAAGVLVRSQVSVHELLVEGGRVTGIGHVALRPGSAAATAHRWLDRLRTRAPGALGGALTRASEDLWAEAVIGTLSCSAVVLALDPVHWEFVGTAVWSAGGAPGGRTLGGGRRDHLRLVGGQDAGDPGTGTVPDPELRVRTWCADRAAAGSGMADLRVEVATGMVRTGNDPVPGLYAAVPGTGTSPGRSPLVTGTLAGRSAAQGIVRRSWPRLRTVG